MKFRPGQIVATPGFIEAAAGTDIANVALRRHLRGDWGDVDDEDKAANDQSLRDGSRLLSSYKTPSGVKFWIITEAEDESHNRCATTFLLPEEY